MLQNSRQKVVNRGLHVRAGGGLTFEFDKNTTDLQLVIFQFGGAAWSLAWGWLCSPKIFRGNGSVVQWRFNFITIVHEAVNSFKHYCVSLYFVSINYQFHSFLMSSDMP